MSTRTVDITSPPAAEPVTLAEAMLFARIEIDDPNDAAIEGELVSSLITAAREAVEGIINRALITQSIRLTLDSFPFGGGYYNRAIRQNPGLGNYLPTNSGRIILPRAPVVSVVAVTYLDQTGNLQTVDPSIYRVVLSNLKPAHLITATNKIWPITYPSEASVYIDTINGYGDDGTNVPSGIKTAIKMLVSNWYNNRDGVEIPGTVLALLGPHETGTY